MLTRHARAVQPSPRDLFGEVPVTWSEVAAWCEAVAGIGADSWRFEYYVRGWNVAEKIRAAKLAGELEQILSGTDRRARPREPDPPARAPSDRRYRSSST